MARELGVKSLRGSFEASLLYRPSKEPRQETSFYTQIAFFTRPTLLQSHGRVHHIAVIRLVLSFQMLQATVR